MGPDSELGGAFARYAAAIRTHEADTERRRWYAALEAAGLTNLEGLAPEVVAERVKAMHTTLVELRDACACPTPDHMEWCYQRAEKAVRSL